MSNKNVYIKFLVDGRWGDISGEPLFDVKAGDTRWVTARLAKAAVPDKAEYVPDKAEYVPDKAEYVPDKAEYVPSTPNKAALVVKAAEPVSSPAPSAKDSSKKRVKRRPRA